MRYNNNVNLYKMKKNMKKLISAVIAIMFIGSVSAQSINIGKVEGEIGVGGAFPTSKLNLDKNTPGAKLFGEVRYNFEKAPGDLGLHLSGTIFHREAESVAQRLKSKSYTVMAVSNYNFWRGTKASLFLGAGLGYARLDMTAPVSFDNSQPNYGGFHTGDAANRVCFMPRVGVEFFNHLRLSLSYTLVEKAHNHISVGISGVIGGGKR